MKKIVFIACDTQNIKKVRKIIKSTSTKKIDIGYKFGLEFFYSSKGRGFIKTLKNKNIFLDLKLNDIPNTCNAALDSLKDMKNIRYLTVHINGGLQMLREVKKKAKSINKNLKILGVTVLTSLTNKSIKQLGFRNNIKKTVLKQALVAKKAKLDGVICSAKEIEIIKKKIKKINIITPGIRMYDDSVNDQKRVVSPYQAFEKGATGIVIGRSVTNGNVGKNFRKLINLIINES